MGYDPKILLFNQFAGYFTFGLFGFLNLILGVHCYIVLVFLVLRLRKWHLLKSSLKLNLSVFTISHNGKVVELFFTEVVPLKK